MTAFLVLGLSVALADTPTTPWDYDAGVGANWVTGNLRQRTLSADADARHQVGRFDGRATGTYYRLTQDLPDATRVVLGDDLSLNAVPSWSVADRGSVLGLVHFGYSQLQGVDFRGLAGGAMGLDVADTRRSSVRLALGASLERTTFVADTFSRDVPHDGPTRTIPRVTLVSDGHHTSKTGHLELRYLAWLHVDPRDPADLRGALNTSLRWAVAGPLGVTLSVVGSGNTVVVEGFQPYDVRTVAGIGVSPPRKANKD